MSADVTGGEVAAVAAPAAADTVSILAAFPVAQSSSGAPAPAPATPGLAMLGDAGAACVDGLCAVPGPSASNVTPLLGGFPSDIAGQPGKACAGLPSVVDSLRT